ncbi:MAG TPA: tetratricopeptide repeat protein [Deltaproteobacteria bacterium]|nr:tetratricopeptide repeat protein [Deltaproteobacteria bacterium]HIJ39478.1 tetratricopeptide repeat protein [Deltaproteobacteria bacterium]
MTTTKKHASDMGEDVLEEKVPLSFTLQWPAMKLGQALGDVVNGYKRMFKIGPSDLKDLYRKKYEAADRKGEIWKSLRWMEKVTAIDPDDPESFYLLGVAHEKSKDREGAIKAYARAIALKPDYAKAYYRMAIQYLADRDFKTSVELLEKALGIEPDSSELHFRLGVAYDRLQKHEKAISHFSEAVKINPDFLKVYKNMALTYDALGKHKEASECLRHALELEETSV